MKYVLLSILSCLAAGAAIFGWMTLDFTASGPLEAPTTVLFAPGAHATAMADRLAAEHVIRHPFFFKIMTFARGDATRFKAGEYAFPAHITPAEAAHMMAAGKTVVHHLTIPEGLMTSEVLALVKTAPALDGEITILPGEGELLPETYNYSRGDKRNDLIARMRRAMNKTLADAWAARSPGLPLATPTQALTLASIVEKETGLPAERPRVAGVYVNRLKLGMLLQADPTSAYAVTGGKTRLPRPLTAADLALASPYNTYRSPGLPPGPIANPGLASIQAALHPLITGDLYFVATGTGGHHFARNEAEHNANVRAYREKMKGR